MSKQKGQRRHQHFKQLPLRLEELMPSAMSKEAEKMRELGRKKNSSALAV